MERSFLSSPFRTMQTDPQTPPSADPQAAEGAPHQDLIAEPVLLDELAQAQDEISKLNDQLLRARAEVENIRRRAEDETAKARKFAVESFAESMLPVKDSLEAALADTSGKLEVLKQGVELTLSQLKSAFERNRLLEIAPAVGDKFDPAVHQAISVQPAEQPAGTVASVLQKGYRIADRTLRPALITVAQ
jgi:molecular chaperone GrpE